MSRMVGGSLRQLSDKGNALLQTEVPDRAGSDCRTFISGTRAVLQGRLNDGLMCGAAEKGGSARRGLVTGWVRLGGLSSGRTPLGVAPSEIARRCVVCRTAARANARHSPRSGAVSQENARQALQCLIICKLYLRNGSKWLCWDTLASVPKTSN